MLLLPYPFLLPATVNLMLRCPPPAMYRLQEHYTEKADVWSLGCVLYHIIMLRPPFDGTNPLSVASKIVEVRMQGLAARPCCLVTGGCFIW